MLNNDGAPPVEQFDVVRSKDITSTIADKSTNPSLIELAKQTGSYYVTPAKVDNTAAQYASKSLIDSWPTTYAKKTGAYATIGATPVAAQFFPAKSFDEYVNPVVTVKPKDTNIAMNEMDNKWYVLADIDISNFPRFKNCGLFFDAFCHVGTDRKVQLAAEYYHSASGKFDAYVFKTMSNFSTGGNYDYCSATGFFKPFINPANPDSKRLKIKIRALPDVIGTNRERDNDVLIYDFLLTSMMIGG